MNTTMKEVSGEVEDMFQSIWHVHNIGICMNEEKRKPIDTNIIVAENTYLSIKNQDTGCF